MKTNTKPQTKRKIGEIVNFNAIADRGGEFMAILERDNSGLQLLEFCCLSRRNSKGLFVLHGGWLVSVWHCRVYGGEIDGMLCEFAIYEPASDLA